MWRDSGLDPKICGLDARCFIPIIVFFLHISVATFFISLAFIILFAILVYSGYTLTTAALRLRSWIVGSRRLPDTPYEFRMRGYPEDKYRI